MKDRRRKRLEDATRREDVRESIQRLRPDLRQVQIDLAEHFLVIDESGHYLFEGGSSVRQFGESLGFSAAESQAFVDAARAMRIKPEVRRRVLSGRISFEAAAALFRILRDEKLIRPGEDWLLKAEGLGVRELRRRIKERIIEVRRSGTPARLTVVLSSEALDKFQRAKDVASRIARRDLDEGQTIEVLSDHYLSSFDEDRKQPRKRRMPDTRSHPGRGIPASVRRKVRERARSGSRVCCQYPNCRNHRYLEYCHIKPHSKGGSREADNLLLLCPTHHALLDARWIRVKGTAAEPVFYLKEVGRDGKTRWRRVRAPPE